MVPAIPQASNPQWSPGQSFISPSKITLPLSPGSNIIYEIAPNLTCLLTSDQLSNKATKIRQRILWFVDPEEFPQIPSNILDFIGNLSTGSWKSSHPKLNHSKGVSELSEDHSLSIWPKHLAILSCISRCSTRSSASTHLPFPFQKWSKGTKG